MTATPTAVRPKIVAGIVAAAVTIATAIAAAPTATAELATPIIELPDPGSQFCDVAGNDFTLSGTANPGLPIELWGSSNGGSGVVQSDIQPNEDGTFSIPLDRPVGDHVFTVREYDGENVLESQPTGTLSVFGLEGVLGWITPSPATISPKTADGKFDTTTFSVPVLRDGRVAFLIYAGETLVAFSPVITAEPGSATWVWNGKGSAGFNGGKPVGTGTYSVRAKWMSTEFTGCSFTRDGTVRVDNTGATVTSVNESPDTVYPREDDELTEYRDDITFSWKGLSEESTVKVEIYKHGTAPVYKTLTYGSDTGDGSLTWNGRKNDGSMFAAGTYDWNLFMTDKFGNVSRTSKRQFVVSHKRIDTKATSVARDGNDYTQGTATGCGGGADDLSYWSTGVWLAVFDCNVDEFTLDATMAEYAWQMPSAPYYHRVEMKVYGVSEFGDPVSGFLHNERTGADDIFGLTTSTVPALKVIGSKPAADYIDSQKKVHGFLFLMSLCDCVDVEYDVRSVYVRLTYGVLVD
jgi:flagellar hook assembly protein FlgD